ncbi:hypothetical protein K449DRAFT_390725 [Hypoxylon sp. EC38]|nr:hypothetical protein K449DRAFT_390725 [Hypoxylon sp. EC38]
MSLLFLLLFLFLFSLFLPSSGSAFVSNPKTCHSFLSRIRTPLAEGWNEWLYV